MFDIESWQEIFETMRKNLLQTILTMVSVFSGIFILVILLGFSTGIQKGVKTQFEQDATNRISVNTRVTTKQYKGLNPGRYIQLRNEDFNEINRKYEDDIEYKTSIYNIWGSQITYNNESGNYRLEGVYPDQQNIENASLTSGRFLSVDDLNASRKVAVIGYQIQKDLFKGKPAVGEMISIFGIQFKVVGVFSDPGGEREETRVFIPLSTSQVAFNGGDKIRSLAYTVKMSDNFDEAVALSEAMSQGFEQDIKAKYSVHPEDRAAVQVRNTLEQAKQIYSLIDTIRNVFWFIGIGTIIAGVVGVSNIMLIVVKERTKEIGIRKAIGALPSSIIMMILQESIFITAVAGFFGLFVGVILLQIVSPLVNNDFIKAPQVDFTTAMTTVIILIVAGGLAGYIPARRAARIKPIEALRDE
ncbi:ABC transporter permease [Jejudonia soesokkakensis]|uniref:ABC transporter permease n=1 Tax=Jejudonia soesokkakensis TaxID=1323432 RepID=A0ABW2MV06_9FLAO